MIERYVILKFKPEEKENFLSIFEYNKNRIASFEGCDFLELRHSLRNPNWLMTYSIWKSEEHLEFYRKSDIFESVWNQVKPLFSDKAETLSIYPNLSGEKEKKREFFAKFDFQ